MCRIFNQGNRVNQENHGSDYPRTPIIRRTIPKRSRACHATQICFSFLQQDASSFLNLHCTPRNSPTDLHRP